MSTISLRPDQLGPMIAAHALKFPQTVQDGLVLGAQRGRSHLVRVSPVDTGIYKNAWRVIAGVVGVGPTILNDAPHAGIIEKGARPHGVNRAGIDALTKWVKRHLTVVAKGQKGPVASEGHRKKAAWSLDDEARKIAFAIAAKIKKEGQKGRFIVETSMPKLTQFAVTEVMRQVDKLLSSKAGT